MIVEFIVKEYGMSKVRELLDSQTYPYDYLCLFNLTEYEFYDAWVAYLRINYI